LPSDPRLTPWAALWSLLRSFSNPRETAQIQSPAYRDTLARAVAEALQ